MQKRIMIFAAGGIGDMLQTTPMIRAIREHYLDAHIVVLVARESQKTILKMNKNVNLVINIFSKEYKSIFGFIKLINKIRNEQTQYCFFNHVVQRPVFYLIPFLSKIKNRIGYDKSEHAGNPGYKIFSKLMTDILPYNVTSVHKILLNLDLLKIIGIHYQDSSYDLELPNRLSNVNYTKKTVGIHPGSDLTGKIRRWSPIQFISLAKKIITELDYNIKIYLGPDDKDLECLFDKEFSVIIDKPLEQVIRDISNCTYFISNDSGLSHIAAALKLPTLVIYGPSLSRDITLPTKYISAEIEGLDCRPCWHLRKPCNIGHICMENLTVEEVFMKFIKLISINDKENLIIDTMSADVHKSF